MIAGILYFLSSIFSFGITYMFIRTKDGILRKIMIWIFSTLGIALLLRSLFIYLTQDVRPEQIIIVAPFFISISIGFFTIYFKYYKRR